MTDRATENPSEKRRVVIIGAGPAGITCGTELLRQAPDRFDVCILEATDTIGGISRTVRAGGNRMDIGGHRFFSKDERIMHWWESILPLQGAPAYDDKELGRPSFSVEGGPDPQVVDEVMLKRHRISRIFYDDAFFDYPISLKASTLRSLGFARTLSVGCSYLKSAVRKLPDTSLENFYVNRFGRKLYSMFFEGYTEKVWGRHPRDISADWGSQRVKGLSIRAVIKDMLSRTPKSDDETETSLIKGFYYPKLGPGQLWETAADEFRRRGGTIHMGTRADRLSFDAQGRVASVHCVDASGASFTIPCDEAVSSIPLVDVARAAGDAMPADARRVAEGLPYRDFVTVGLLVDRLSIGNRTDIPTLGNIVPDNWIYVQDAKVKLGRLQIFNNWSPYLVEDARHTVWVGLEYFCEEGDAFWCLSDEECIEYARQELAKIGIITAEQPILQAHRERVPKAYPAYFDTYEDIDVLRDWLQSVPNLYCVGRNGQHRYNNMDHSMLTALYTADLLCGGAVTQRDIWSVNTETSYQESSDDGNGSGQSESCEAQRNQENQEGTEPKSSGIAAMARFGVTTEAATTAD